MSDNVTFSGNILQNQIETPKSSQGLFDLPCGYIDTQGVLHSEVHLREMTGREEDLLASTKVSNAKKVNALLAACTERIGGITEKAVIAQVIPVLPQGDRVFMLIALRRTTLGDEYPVEEVCPECSAKGNYLLDLGTLDVKHLEDPMKRVFDVALPSGKKARFRLGIGSDEDRMMRASEEDRPSMVMLSRMEMLDGKVPTIAEIKGLSWRDRQALRSAMEANDAGVDTTMTLDCPSCGHTFDREVNMGDSGFFFPDRVQKPSKARSST